MANKQDMVCRIEVLGTLRVVCGDQTLTRFPRQKAARLLTYLALHPKQAHPRETLVDLFWPDLDLPAGRDSLSTTLTALRRLLKPPSALLTTHQTVSLNWERVATDAAEFELLIRRAEREADLHAKVKTLEQASALYRGEACVGLYDDWALREAERLHRVCTEALRGLTGAYEQLGSLAEARRAAERWVAADAYCEDAHLRLIALHVRAGHPSAARAAAKKLESLWREEFGAPPAPAVQAALADILAPAAPSAPPAPVPAAPLPLPLDTFFGREKEFAWLEEWLTGGTRLVTLAGPGGMGKTRLALDFARRSAGRFTSCFVPLAETEDPAQLLPAIVRALALTPSAEPLGQLAAHFEAMPRPLLILDNLEQLVAVDKAAAQAVQSLLLAAPGLCCLCTSRLPLSLRGERLLPVEPLPLPLPLPLEESASPRVDTYASVQLYVDRARAVRPDFSLTPENAPAVAAVCRHLDGSPLALELAASWVRLLPPRAMWERLSRQFGVTDLETRRSDAPARHHSLRAALDWSWRLLKPDAQRLLARASVFRGGWTLDAAETVCREPNALAALSDLLEASLVRVTEEDGQTRYRLLETVRQYARERLEEQGELGSGCRCHAAWVETLVESAEMNGPQQVYWYSCLDAEYDNINAALDWLLQDPGGTVPGLKIAGRMQQFWQVRGMIREGREKITAFLERPGAEAPTAARARALHGAANLASRQADHAAAAALHRESLAIRRAFGDEVGIARSLMGLGIAAMSRDDLECAQVYYEEVLALYRRLGDTSGLGDVLNDLGNLAAARGYLVEAGEHYRESLAVRRARSDWQSVANVLSNLGPFLTRLGDCSGAAEALRECLMLCRELGDRRDGVHGLKAMAELELVRGRQENAVRLLGAEAALRAALGMPRVHCREMLHQEKLAALRQQMLPVSFKDAWAQGQAMTWEETVACALAL